MFDVEHNLEKDIKTVNEAIDQHKTKTSASFVDLGRRVSNNDRYIYQNECDIADVNIKLNDLEQYTRRNSIRIHGMREQGRGRYRENTLRLVSNFFYNELELEPDVEIAHRVGVKSTDPDKPRTIIVKFVRRSDKLAVMLRRKSLKGSGLSISDDLTLRNVRLIKEVRDNERIESVWSWDGKVYARGQNGYKFLLHPGIDIDAELDKINQGD